MDRPLLTAGRWTRAQLVAAAAVTGLIVLVLVLFASAGRWSKADKAVDSTTVRFETVTHGDLLHDVAVQGRGPSSGGREGGPWLRAGYPSGRERLFAVI